jgi:spore maturation protein CgeB
MKIVVLGLSLSSSWGNGHATTYRALLRELGRRHEILFLERDQPWYAAHRDLPAPDFCALAIYRELAGLTRHRGALAAADMVLLGSYVPQGAAVAAMIRPWVRGAFCFYDIDTPVTLAALESGGIDYLHAEAIPLFDIYFSFTGGPILQKLQQRYGARCALPLYCSVDPAQYHPLRAQRRWGFGYLGTYSADRQPVLERLLLEPARRLAEKKFVVAGAMYPQEINWPANVERIEHLPPAEHAAFYNAQTWTLNVTRADMVAAGYSPSVRLFEATACGTPVISDAWPGLGSLFEPGRDIMLAGDADDVLSALLLPERERSRIAAAGRRRCLAAHTAAQRAATLEQAVAMALSARLAGVGT